MVRNCQGETMKNQVIIAAGVLFFGLLCGAAGQRDKPWTEWSAKDAEKILNESAWSHTQTEVDMKRPNPLSPSLSEIGALGQSSRINYRIRFLSAKPVRQAFYRLVQLNPKAPGPGLLQKLEAFISADFSEAIVVGVDFDSSEPRLLGPALSTFGSAITSMLAPQTYLEVGGKRAFLKEYQPPNPNGIGGAWFIFLREMDGKPFIDDKSVEVRFHADFPQSDSKDTQLKLDWRFKVSSFRYNGVLEF
jgi:hypothetical protein